MLLQHLLEIPPRVTAGMLGHLLRRTRHHDLSSLVSPFWTKVHDPVSTANHIEIVLIGSLKGKQLSECIAFVQLNAFVG